MLQIGTKAPSFELYDQNGTLHKLEDYKGKKVILYFYPKDNTPGCTKEACGYNENLSSFNDKNVVILGISKDSVSSHKKFESNFGLGFTLLSDENLDAIKKYDVWKEKKNYGKTYMGILRTTYLINEEGIIVFANDKVKAASDALTMLEKI
ncbi:MAG: thioredoxin-dependent thiol peroxidase [Candidatus Onthovivens sp.]|nr:thioredoxin-dependent thiol peroxidase [Candidatus Onthovivens sp.]